MMEANSMLSELMWLYFSCCEMKLFLVNRIAPSVPLFSFLKLLAGEFRQSACYPQSLAIAA